MTDTDVPTIAELDAAVFKRVCRALSWRDK